MPEGRREEQLAQLNRLAEALREFGATDRFGIGELLTGDALPAVNAIERRLKQRSDRLPAGISAALIAQRIHARLARLGPPILDPSERPILFDSPMDALTDAELASLRKVPRGQSTAADYQRRVGRIIGTAYRGELVDGALEVEITGGRRRVDVVFRNAATEGFFQEIQTVHSIHAPRIWIECKNYSKDAANPEVDQLGGRLGPDQGMFGILSCRTTKNQQLLAARVADLRNKDRKWIITMSDDDWITLGKAFLKGDRSASDAVLRQRLNALLYA